ncbi:unnamed protein product [Pleuronectes platessa]|uniref:Uncharacterized protein n=1 Tax=Pleuronectes platessa TaxID=8262 RepID=A0A9N7YVK1_PLEPL|nr:unnamed protein product [Pleuronectes platessa]
MFRVMGSDSVDRGVKAERHDAAGPEWATVRTREAQRAEDEATVCSAAAAAAGGSSSTNIPHKEAGKWVHGRKGGWGGKTPRYSPMLLKLSDKVLLNFFILPIFSAGLEAGIMSHIFLSSSSTDFWRRAGGGLDVVLQRGSRTALRSALRGFSSPAAAAAEHRKRRRSSSHSSHQLVRATVLWRLSQGGNYISKETIKVRTEAGASTGRPVSVVPCSTAAEMSFLGFLSPVSTPPDPALAADWRSPGVNRVPIRCGGWLSGTQRRPHTRRRNMFTSSQVGACAPAGNCCPLQDPGRGIPQTSAPSAFSSLQLRIYTSCSFH